MTATRRPSRLGLVALLVALVGGGLPATAFAGGDVTPPTGTMEYWAMDNVTQLAELRFSYSDSESGLDHILFICDNGPEYVVPYAAKVFLPIHDGSAGCSTTYGNHEVLAWVVNGDGLSSLQQYAPVANGPTMTVGLSPSPTTGHAVTITPHLPDDFTIPAGAFCRWEFRWGTTSALDTTFTGDTFGGLLFDGKAADGGCGAWTFTLPWVPFRQFDVIVELGQLESDGGMIFGPRAHARFSAAVDSTERRILASNLPIAQVLPSTYSPIVGQPITYTRYLVGGASACCNPQWNARLGAGETPVIYTQSGGATFTFTPSQAGDVFVQWYRFASSGLELLAYYDPPVRYRDYWAPVATAPRQRIRPMATGDAIPIAIEWGGSDKGWGIASYALQRSVNGATWKTVVLPSPTAKSIGLNGTLGSTLRFRVRAKDKAGRLGAWAYGPTVRVGRAAETNAAVHYSTGWATQADPGAFGGAVRATSGASKALSFTFSGRDVGWIASRGLDHGKARIYVDGTYIGSVDLYAASRESRRIIFARHWTAFGTHTVRIVNVATSGRPWIDDDGFAVLR